MKNRLQFVKGFQSGTLNEDEKKILDQFPVTKKAAEEPVTKFQTPRMEKVYPRGGRE